MQRHVMTSRRTPEGRLVTPFLDTLEPEAVRGTPGTAARDEARDPASR
ncbi:hypothetical protein [Cellulomonas triticagri]|nr:hypothetical protein [Cellulomonas triticagri]